MVNSEFIYVKIQDKKVASFVWRLLICISIVLSINIHGINAQNITVELEADSTHITIGDYLNVRLVVKFPGGINIIMPPVADTVGNMELVTASKIDTVINNSFTTLSLTYTLSAYDSGIYHAGPQRIFTKTADGIVDTLFSNAINITVYTVPVDTAKAFMAIKAPIEVPYSLEEFIPYILGTVLLIVIITAVVWYIQSRRRMKPKVIERPKPKDPAPVWARKELKKLEEEKLWQKNEIKLYYSRLTDILRLYIEYRYGWLALESTTEEITEGIDLYGIRDEAKKNLLTILTEADLVKFAKKIPVPDTNLKMMEQAYRFIDFTEIKEFQKEDVT